MTTEFEKQRQKEREEYLANIAREEKLKKDRKFLEEDCGYESTLAAMVDLLTFGKVTGNKWVPVTSMPAKGRVVSLACAKRLGLEIEEAESSQSEDETN